MVKDYQPGDIVRLIAMRLSVPSPGVILVLDISIIFHSAPIGRQKLPSAHEPVNVLTCTIVVCVDVLAQRAATPWRPWFTPLQSLSGFCRRLTGCRPISVIGSCTT